MWKFKCPSCFKFSETIHEEESVKEIDVLVTACNNCGRLIEVNRGIFIRDFEDERIKEVIIREKDHRS